MLYAGTQGNGFGSGGVFRSTNGASSWQRLDRGLTGDLITAFAITPNGTVYAATQGDGITRLTASH